MSAESAAAMCEQTGCAGVVIGRQALKYPWVIRDAAARLQGRDQFAPPSPAEHVDFMQQHLDRMACEYGDELAAKLFRRWTPQYAKGLQIGRREMIRILRINDIEALRDAIEELKQ